MTDTVSEAPAPARPDALILRRLLAMFYDL